jgi:hypothetical protein
MVPDDDGATERTNNLHTLVRTRVIPHHIACAKEIGHTLSTAVVEDDVQRVEVCVYVAEYSYDS